MRVRWPPGWVRGVAGCRLALWLGKRGKDWGTEWMAGLQCPSGGGEDQAGPLRGLGMWLVGRLWHGWVTPGFMITVCGRKCLKTKHFRPQTAILTHGSR